MKSLQIDGDDEKGREREKKILICFCDLIVTKFGSKKYILKAPVVL